MAGGEVINYPKVGIKLVILLVIGALLGIGLARQRRGDQPSPVRCSRRWAC